MTQQPSSPRLRQRWHRSVTAALVALAFPLAACGSDSDDASPGSADDDAVSSDPIELAQINYYEGEPARTALPTMLDECADQVGVVIDHQMLPRDQLMPRLLQQATTGDLPELILVDNPDLQQLASTGALAELGAHGLSADDFFDSIAGAGSYDGGLFGLAPGVNGLALFYNQDVFDEAGLEPPATWEELKDTAAALTDGTDRYGLGFSAPANEEGTWQFLPFFWTGGAELDQLDSPEAIAALQLVADLVDAGSAPQSVVGWTQNDVKDQFAAGRLAMMINGPWNIPPLDEEGVNYGIATLPTPEPGGTPVSPLGGEVWAAAATGDEREAKAAEVIACMTSDEKSLAWSTLTNYVPTKASAAAEMAGESPILAAFVEQAETARARTAELGADYPKVSAALSNALQAVLAGGESPESALAAAQQAASN